jgi:hypothetical protein
MIILTSLYFQSDIESIISASNVAKHSSATSISTAFSQVTRVDDIQLTQVNIIRMLELTKPLESKTRLHHSAAVPETLQSEHQNGSVAERPPMLEASKRSRYVIYLSFSTFINFT